MITQKKKRGPKPTGKGELIGVRIQPPKLARLDYWISQQEDAPSRPEAIRRLLEQGLAGPYPKLPKTRRRRWQAERLIDLATSLRPGKNAPAGSAD